MVKVAVITYSLYGHIDSLAVKIKEGVEKAGGKADIFRVEETLSEELLTTLAAPSKGDYPLATLQTLEEYDAFLFGIPTRYGNVPQQWSTFWDTTGGLWQKGTLNGKPAGIFVSTASPGGGQETTIRNSLSYLVHHGMIFVPLGFKNAFAELSNTEEIHGGSAWGAGVIAAGDGSRAASDLELKIAVIQGQSFYEVAKKIGKKPAAAPAKAKTDASAARKTEKPVVEEKKSDSCCTIM
ncbi:unnamed protein product [Kluyveromyces dobzhanskii CBS 2104]|uniref:WGS project CCBQ000000000 data, contig 00014 n=1 Tax=Kluyveromyces dobzhanskii CBS 2104 TaxID=1427455 RepID=A0A0A8L6R2_9SACH|nr:unnamed protein product [Kluyveromyces dobzhanskii CBS 2104]